MGRVISSAAETTTAVERILVISPWGISGGYSGPLTLMDRLFARLSHGGVSTIDVIHRARAEDGEPPEWVGRATSVAAGSPYSRLRQIGWGLRVRRLIRRTGGGYDAIHLHGFYLANQIAIAGFSGRARIVALPVLEGGDLGSPDSQPRFSPKRLMTRFALRSVDVGLALSAQIASDFRALGLDPFRVSEIGNPADGRLFTVGDERRTRHDPVTIGFVGKVGGFKNPDLVLRALRVGLDRGKAWRALFVGPFPDDATSTRITALVDELELADRVEFVGYTRDVTEHLERMDVFVLPSSQEGLPGALTEAMAAALPCVVSDEGSMAFHVTTAQAGFVVPRDPSEIADALDAATSGDWPRLSASAHAYALRSFSPDAVSDTYLTAVTSARHAGDHS